jgi:hypothetical protein
MHFFFPELEREVAELEAKEAQTVEELERVHSFNQELADAANRFPSEPRFSPGIDAS